MIIFDGYIKGVSILKFKGQSPVGGDFSEVPAFVKQVASIDEIIDLEKFR